MVRTGKDAGIDLQALTRLIRHECPLHFSSGCEWQNFCSELANCVFGALSTEFRKNMGGVTVGINGSGCTLFSENPKHFYRSFDACGAGSSDVDVYLYFDNDSDISLRKVFLNKNQRKGALKHLQYCASWTQDLFQLKKYYKLWSSRLQDRPINVVTLRAAGRASRDSAFNFTLHFPGDWDIAPPSISTNAKQICESQPALSTLCATPERLIVSASPLAARGLYALKRGKEVDSHYERTYPPSYDASNRDNRLAMYISHADSKEPKIDLILEFLRQRRIDHLLEMDQLLEPTIFRMGDIPHKHGTWWRAELKNPLPRFPKHFVRSTLQSREGKYERAIHSTSMYYIWNILVNALLPGSGFGKGSLRGVYCFPMQATNSQAQSSSGYSVYSGIGKDGFYWTVRLELAVARFMAGREKVGKMTASGKIPQWVCPDDTYHVNAVWFHCIHQDDFAEVHQWVMFDEWHPAYEQLPAGN